MAESLFLRGYAAKILLEASEVPDDAFDKNRYYKLEVGSKSDGSTCTYSAKSDSGSMLVSSPRLAIRGLDTSEALSSEQGASVAFSGDSAIAVDLVARIRPMDRLRIEITNGSGWRLAFDGFVSEETKRRSSTLETYSSDFTLSASGLWKLLSQSWFNWQGILQPSYDVYKLQAGKSLYKWLSDNAQKLPPQDIIRAFIETALSLVELRTGEGPIQAGKFFQFGTGEEWASAFGIAYPYPVNTLPYWKGPLTGMIHNMAQPDIHECFCTYRSSGDVERPTIIYRPRPFPGEPGSDSQWNNLTLHRIVDEPAAKSISETRSDGQHPNAFHWAVGSTTDSGYTEIEQKTMRGCFVDVRSIKRYGFSMRECGSSLPTLSLIRDGNKQRYVDDVVEIMRRIAYQEAPLPEMWNRAVQLPLRPGIRPGDVVEEYSSGRAWTGYVVSVRHRISASPWNGATTVQLVRCLPCTFEEYPAKCRERVQIEYRAYWGPETSGGADAKQIAVSRRTPIDPSDPNQQPIAGVPWGSGILAAAKNRGVPPWVLAHVAQVESSFGANPNTEVKGGFMQFEKDTANGLNALGYDKPFNWETAKADPAASLDAGAWYASYCKKKVDGLAPASLTEDQRWQWALYGYNRGPSKLTQNGPAQGWQFSPADKSMTQYGIYWGPGAMEQAKAEYGGLK